MSLFIFGNEFLEFKEVIALILKVDPLSTPLYPLNVSYLLLESGYIPVFLFPLA
jgi:hypothetical protein